MATSPRSPARNTGLGICCRVALLAVCCAPRPLVLRGAGSVPAEIGVRSALADPYAPVPQPAASAEGRKQGPIYYIASIQQISGDELISPPISVKVLLRQARQALESRGFHAIEKGQRPDLVFTVEYGRDWLDNPYLDGTRDLPPMVGVSSVPPANGAGLSLEQLPHQTITGAPVQLMNQFEAGREAKIQKAESEKLYIRLNAWQYQADAKARPRLLWVTTRVVDDPDHVDLNAVSVSMLAAGAPYFGREIRDGEITIPAPVPDGHVKVGAPQVLDPLASPAAPVAVQPPPAPPPAAEPRKKFDLPAGAAASALQAYSRQSGLEVIYPVEQVRAIRTKRVSGELNPRTALERLLAGTGLVAVRDEMTGAIAVRPASPR